MLVVFGDVQVLVECNDVDLFEKQGFDLGDLASGVLNSKVGVYTMTRILDDVTSRMVSIITTHLHLTQRSFVTK